MFSAPDLEHAGEYHLLLTFTCVSFCPQDNDVRIILGQFDQHMAAKVFCCVSKTLIMSIVSLGKFTKLFLRRILTARSVSEILGLESGSKHVLLSALSSFHGAKAPGLKTVQP